MSVKRGNEGDFVNFYQEDEAEFERNAHKVDFSDHDYKENKREIIALRRGARRLD